ncbi:hypothetical protein, variant [Blastomyces gilchristii SLH14081]|uniref:Phosphotransferase enzyme family protein n=1 Tax=Blastomyces gilchristii (strain SLH14081) TaxID=559298 RepID=A0A179UUZ4_BLAGS|nr:uncharacterized protein BDBG_07280 [Blastomyces gilchristii SLH14081]XP_031580085.1 hypothetical protein, variant [Blastomyces gilchristii SLH14081]OAT11864.1 hypothetical protein BDBG_07280 [Blastomyces gilchristii SLH14081]OAT11865.1 hypothetical protein, variant [Blastomyces gilchristii SLH14081]
MEFIATNTTIPVPKVYETRWSGNRTRLSQIVMEYIPGESLDTAWGKLTHDQRMSVCHQLRGYLSQLQNLTSKTKRIEAANGGPITAGLRFPRRGAPLTLRKSLMTSLLRKMVMNICPSSGATREPRCQMTMKSILRTAISRRAISWLKMVWSRRFWTEIEQVGTLSIGTRIGCLLKTLG